jgi:hypothetical protein
LVYSLCFPFILLIVNIYRHYSPRSTSSSDGRLPRSFVRSDGVFPTFRTSGRVGFGFEVPRHGCSGFNAFSDDCGFYYCSPPRHGGSAFDALWHGGSGFDANLGDVVGFGGRLHDGGFDYSPPRHGYDGYGVEESGSRFDGNLGGGFGFDGHVPNRGINYSPTRHGHGGSGFTAPRRGDSGFDTNVGGGPGFNGLGGEQRIQYSTYWRGGGGFDSPRLDPCSHRADPFPFLTAAGVPLDAGEDDSTCRWARIPLDAGEDLSTRRWPRIPLDAGEDHSTRRRPRIPLDAGEDQTTRLRLDSTDIRREDAVEDFLTHRRLHISQVAVGDSSTRLRPHHPLDTASPTQDGPISVEFASPTKDLAAYVAGGSSPNFPLRTRFLLPCSTDRNLRERSAFCCDVLGDRSRFGSLLEESIYNLGFVYEEGDVDFRKADAHGRLTNLGKLSLQRWESGLSAIHFIFPSKKQASNVRTAEGPHYQATFHEFILAMHKYRGPDIRFVFYDPNCNHSNEFLFILNGAAANQYTSAITWQKIKKRIKLDCRSVTTTSTLRQAAGNFADYGFCTSQNSNRKESITGHAMPALKPNSAEPEIVGAFVTLTSFASNTRPLWRPDNNHFALIDAATLKDFTQTIHPRNKIPSMHLAVTNKEHPCGCHNDASTNSKDHPDVVYISIIQGGEESHATLSKESRLMTTSFDALILVSYYRLLKRCTGRWTDVVVRFLLPFWEANKSIQRHTS